MTPLTPADLAALLTAVPFSAQQRDEPVRLHLRPGLAADYHGPVTLRDVRLALSPWHWLGGELAHSPRSEHLSRALAAARARTAAPDLDLDLDTIEGVAGWVKAELEDTGLDWYPVPGDAHEWGEWGPTEEEAAGTGCFLPPGLALPAVLFMAWDAPAGDGRIVVAQVRWQGATGPGAGPVGIYASSARVAVEGSAQPAWLMGWGALLLTDPATGEQAELSPHWTDGADAGDTSENQDGDAAEEPGPEKWAGQETRFEAGTFSKSDPGREPDWLRGGLHYAAGHLLRADTGQALTITPYLLPEPRRH